MSEPNPNLSLPEELSGGLLNPAEAFRKVKVFLEDGGDEKFELIYASLRNSSGISSQVETRGPKSINGPMLSFGSDSCSGPAVSVSRRGSLFSRICCSSRRAFLPITQKES